MSWVALALAVVKFGLAIFGWAKDRAQQQIGGDREKLRQFTAMQAVSFTLDAVDERFAKMSDEEILEEVEKQGDYRD